jgi:hypothetical protein
MEFMGDFWILARTNQLAGSQLPVGRVHKTLRITPAMAAGMTDHVWSLEEIAMLADRGFGANEARAVQEGGDDKRGS